MKHRAMVVTCGEKTTEQVIKNIPLEQVTVWYDSRGKINWDFFQMCGKYVDDVILLSKNHGSSAAYSFASLYLPCDYIWIVNADAMMLPDTIERAVDAFNRFPKAVAVGGIRSNNFPEKEWISNNKSQPIRFPDEMLVLNRKIINDVGGICASLKGYGHETLEFFYRAIDKGYEVVTLNNFFEELGSGHEGREGNPNMQQEIDHNSRVIHKTNELRISGYNWWNDRMVG